MWMWERYRRDSDFWTQPHLTETVRAIYEQFYTHITNWHLPHFFLLNDDDAQSTTDDDVTDVVSRLLHLAGAR